MVMSKIELNDFIYLGRLFEIYGSLLSEDRQKIMASYFEFNMTLAEIAVERNISRQAVLDAIDKSCEKLKSLENSLRLYTKRETLKEDLLEIKYLADKTNETRISEKIENVLKEI